MTQQTINVGTAPDDRTGDPVRTAFQKVNGNFSELYNKPSGGGSIDAGSTPTTGFLSQQMLLSDGSVLQAVKAGTTINLGDTDYPVYMGAFNNTNGINPCITFSGSGYRTADAIAFWTGPYLGISMTGGDNPGVMHQQTFFGFATDTNSISTSPDTAFTVIKNAVAGFRNLGAPTSPESLRVYNTFSDYSNGEWAAFDWHTVPGTLTIGAQANGSGVVHPVDIVGSALTFNGAPIGGGGGGLPLTGGNLSGPLNINTATQPMMTLGWPQDTTLMQFTANTITLNGNGGPAPAISNKTYLGVNQVGFGHKSYQGGNTPIYLSQSNQGEFYIALGAGAPFPFSDLKNGHAIRISADAGNAIVYGSDGSIYVPRVATSPIIFPSYAVAALPASPGQGARAFATDSTYSMSNGVGNAVVGGGTWYVSVYNDGTTWRIG